MNFTKLNVADLTLDAANGAINGVDNFAANLIAQVVIYGQMTPINAMDVKALKGLGLNAFRNFNPAKFSAKNGEWKLNKEKRIEILAEFNVTMDDADSYAEFGQAILEMVVEARETEEAAATKAQAEEKAKKSEERNAKAQTSAAKEKKIADTINREFDREGDAIDPMAILNAMVAKMDKDAMINALELKLAELRG